MRTINIGRSRSLRSGFDGGADFDGHLSVIYLAFVDVAARLDHLEPAQVFDGFMRTLDGRINGVLDGTGGGAGKLAEFIDMVFHGCVLELLSSIPVMKTMNAGKVAFRQQIRLGLEPVLHVAAGLRTLVFIAEIGSSGYFVRRRLEINRDLVF